MNSVYTRDGSISYAAVWAQLCDFVLAAMPLTLLDNPAPASPGHGAARELLKQCSVHGTSIVLGAPFASGILATGAVPGAMYNYSEADCDVSARVRHLSAIASAHDVPLAALALAYPLRRPEVVSVVPGLSSPYEVQRAVDTFGLPIPEACWAELEAAELIEPLGAEFS
jgi:D-threo-aldose 1-dehydrogenase